MIEQLYIFDLPKRNLDSKNLFGEQECSPLTRHIRRPRHDTSFVECPVCRNGFHRYHGGMKYCSFECKRRVNSKAILCGYCGKKFFSLERKRKYCCHDCSVYGNVYGTIGKYKSIILDIKRQLESGLPNKQVAKNLGIPYAAIKRVIDKEYAGVSPCHKRAIDLYNQGLPEEEICKLVGHNKGRVITWLLNNIEGYKPPPKEKSKQGESRKEKRQTRAKYLAAYRKLKTVKAVADYFNVGDEKAQSILSGCKAYKRARVKARLKQKKYTRTTRSRKYKNELAFEDVVFEKIKEIDARAQRQVCYLGQKTCDIVCTIAGIKYAIELKTELKEPKFSSCSMQAFVAAKMLGAVAIYCHPDDCEPTESGAEVISIVFDGKVRVMNEKKMMEFLYGQAKKAREDNTGAGGCTRVYEGIRQQALCVS